MMIRTRAIAMAACLAASISMSADAQSQPPAQACDAVLAAPTRDSVLLRVLLSVHAFDRERELPEDLQFDLGEAVRKHLLLPRPLGVDAYESSGDTIVARTAHMTVRGNYGGTLTADGRIIDASATGGAHTAQFDNAVLSAMHAIDSTDHLSLRDAGLPGGDVEIRVKIVAQDSTTLGSAQVLPAFTLGAFAAVVTPFGPRPPSPSRSDIPHFGPVPVDAELLMPLFSFRVPVRAVTQSLAIVPGTGRLSYPSSLLDSGTMGQTEAAFVVDADGRPEPASLQFVYATRREFAQAVHNAMPQFRYRPLLVSGCPVRSLAEQPFQFYVSKQR